MLPCRPPHAVAAAMWVFLLAQKRPLPTTAQVQTTPQVQTSSQPVYAPATSQFVVPSSQKPSGLNTPSAKPAECASASTDLAVSA
eukprot:1389010-Pleurochrysis_carterae.AAC.1